MYDPTVSAQIITDPAILGGKPIIAGTRISVQLTREQVTAALAYAATAMGTPVTP